MDTELNKKMECQSAVRIADQYLQRILPEQLNSQLVRKLPLEFLKKQCAIPIMLEDGQVAIAMAEPLNIEAYDAILSVLAQPCTRVICPASEIEKAISRCYYQNTSADNDHDGQDLPGGDNDVDISSVQAHPEDPHRRG